MVQKFAPLVKRQIEYYQQQIAYYGPDHPRYRKSKIDLYRDLVRDFGQLLDHLNAEEGTNLKPDWSERRAAHMPPATPIAHSSPPVTSPTPPLAPPSGAKPKDDLADLPLELLAELSGGAKAETDPLIQIINKRGGTASLDDILIDLYRAYNEIGKRTVIGNKLYRLARRELCWPVPGRKGIYTTTKPAAAVGISNDDTSEDDEGPGAATSGPSNEMGAAGSPVGPIKSAPTSSIPFASTPLRRKLMSETSTLASRLPFEQGGAK
jgi:hypothetical protein